MTEPTREHRGLERVVALSFLVSAAAAVGLGVVYWRGGQPQLEGALLGAAFGGLAIGFVTWGNHLMPQGPYVGERHELASDERTVEALEDDLERGGQLTRRRLIIRSLAVAGAALGGAALFPLRSLGPRPGRALDRTPWRRGLRLVTEDGRAVHRADVPVGGIVTVFPEGHTDAADAQAVLVRVDPALLRDRAGRDGWSPDGFLAFSKICTHAGCPVGLYQAQSHTLLCPCHQSTFDVLDGARPVFGPAAAPLPQLPLVIAADGELHAGGDFSEPVGPSYWRRT